MLRFRRTLGVALACALAACAQVPVVETAQPPPPSEAPLATSPPHDAVATAMAQQRRQVIAARARGDLAAAATHLAVLATLAPDDAAIARELAVARTEIGNAVREQYRIGHAALAAGDLDRAHATMLRVLALDPHATDAAAVLRDIDRRRFTRIQAARVARLPAVDDTVAKSAPRPAATPPTPAPTNGNDGFAIDQAIELLRAGDTHAGLRDLKAYVAAHPGDRAGRQRIGAAVAERAQDLERQGQREEALRTYEQASALRGDAGGAWVARMEPLRKRLSQDYFAKGTRAFRTNLTQAIADLEASLRFDPGNTQAAIKLAEAKAARAKLEAIK